MLCYRYLDGQGGHFRYFFFLRHCKDTYLYLSHICKLRQWESVVKTCGMECDIVQ